MIRSSAQSPELHAPKHAPDIAEEAEHHENWVEWARVGFVAIMLALVGIHAIPAVHGLDLVGIAGILIGGYPIFREAVADLLRGRMTMELSMTIALVAASVTGELFTALFIALFVLVAEILEGLTVGRGRRAIRQLLDLLPQSAEVRTSGGTTSRSLGEVAPGDVVIVRPGARIPVDGTVSAGHSFVDQSAITGESMPAEKAPGARAFAGTINHSGVLEVRTEKIGRDTAFGRIIEAVERAERSRAPIQRTADRLAGYLVYFALGCAALTFFITHNPRSTISVIVVAGACGIAAGTPLAILGAIGRAARSGAVIKGGVYLEALGSVTTIVLDKTGTVTLGAPRIVAIRPRSGFSERQVIRIAATAERFSEHPLAKAVVAKASEWKLPVGDPDAFEYLPGKGVRCTIDGMPAMVGAREFVGRKGAEESDEAGSGLSEIFVGLNGGLLGSIRIEDDLRPDAAEAVRRMNRMGYRTVLLTGDRKEIAGRIGAELGVSEVLAELLPEQKVEYVQKLRAAGQIVAMIGDGINDAPALVEANVGVGMGSGTDVARESASVVLLGDDLLRFVDVLETARRCRRIIMANFTGTLVVDGVGVLLAAVGFLNPVIAAVIHVSSELVFICNSARLLPRSVKAS
jgi:Cd2+/Zn2+-exporting ATPase/Cu+-exporting ATPase